MKILFLEKNLSKGSPLTTLSQGLAKHGVISFFADFSKLSNWELIALYRKVDLVILQHYSGMSDYDQRKILLASVIGCPIIRNWAGTDSLNSISEASAKNTSLSLNKFISSNICTNHIGLINELKSINIECKLTPQIIGFEKDASNNKNSFPSSNILAYLPSRNKEFYGSNFIENLIKKYKKVNFIIIADEEGYFTGHDNVTSLKWVDSKEMNDIWNNIGLLIRITKHDGYPRMVIEAKARGKYVIHNNDYIDGIWSAHTQEKIEYYVDLFLTQTTENIDGLKAYESLKKSNPEQQLFNYLASIKLTFNHRLKCIGYLIHRLVKEKLSF